MKKYNVTISIEIDSSKLNDFLWALWDFCNEQLKKPAMRNTKITWSEVNEEVTA